MSYANNCTCAEFGREKRKTTINLRLAQTRAVDPQKHIANVHVTSNMYCTVLCCR